MIFDPNCMTSTIATNGGTLTFADVMAAVDKMHEIAPMTVRENPYATKTEPSRAHTKRHNQSEAYHRRVQKKWVKRWGTKQVPAAYMVDLGVSGRTLVAHPQYVATLRNLAHIGAPRRAGHTLVNGMFDGIMTSLQNSGHA